MLAVEEEFGPVATKVEKGVPNLEPVCQQIHTELMAVTNHEANDIVAPSRKNPLEVWRNVQKRFDPTTGGRKRKLLRTITSPGRCTINVLQAGLEKWESCVSHCEKTLKKDLDDELKLAGLEAPVPEELERHLLLNSNRVRTFEAARVEVVTYFEAQDWLDNLGVDTHFNCGHGGSGPMDVEALASLGGGKGKGSGPKGGCFTAAIHVQRYCRKDTCRSGNSWSKSGKDGKTSTALHGGGLGSVVSGVVPVNQRRRVAGGAREVDRCPTTLE